MTVKNKSVKSGEVKFLRRLVIGLVSTAVPYAANNLQGQRKPKEAITTKSTYLLYVQHTILEG